MVKSAEMYIPPNRMPRGIGRNPKIVTNANKIMEKRLIDFFLAGFQKISAIRTRTAVAVRISS
jgi:hypothetical protein